MARDISKRFHIDPRKTASLLDSTSCIVQCLIPYGAQTLLATGLAGISPGAPFPYLYYPWALAAMVLLSILFSFPRRLNRSAGSGTSRAAASTTPTNPHQPGSTPTPGSHHTAPLITATPTTL